MSDDYDDYSEEDEDDGFVKPPMKQQKTYHNSEEYSGFVSVYDIDNDSVVFEEKPSSLATIEQNNTNGSSFLNPAISTDFEGELGTCPICLEHLDNPSIPDCCTHQFCFICIVHWSSTTTTCPLCKKQFDFILHNIKSPTEYTRYYPREDPSSTKAPTRPTPSSSSQSRSSAPSSKPRPSNSVPTPPVLQSDAHSQRKAVYGRRLKARAATIPYLSPSILKAKPNLITRLKPWLTRELQVLLHIEDVSLLVELVISLLKRYDTNKDKQLIQQQLKDIIPPEHVGTFLHEMLSFAVSTHPTMAMYDKHVQYETQDGYFGSLYWNSASHNLNRGRPLEALQLA